ncbi:MAG: hypothetical protein ACI9UA_001326 [Pseudoalteromonas tetraodonis]|jgi:cytochrome c556
MKKKLLVLIALPVATALLIAAEKETAAKPSAPGSEVPVPVDDSMHHLMEYVFEPAYKRLKASMPDEPADKKAWSAMKADSLTLAESSNLLLHRLPEEDGDQWLKLAVKTREAGGELYQAARKKDYAAAKKHFGLMLNRCNACHDKFADGDYQLKP